MLTVFWDVPFVPLGHLARKKDNLLIWSKNFSFLHESLLSYFSVTVPNLWFGKSFWGFLPPSQNHCQNTNAQRARNIHKWRGLDIKKNNPTSTVIIGNWPQLQWRGLGRVVGERGHGLKRKRFHLESSCGPKRKGGSLRETIFNIR